jgi:hypothetical protein
VKRRHGDRYTLGDLWPPIRKELRKTAAAAATAEEIDRYLHLRDLMGAHYNEWAESASAAEIARLAVAVLALLRTTQCQTCKRWVERSPIRGQWVCRCGATVLQ